MLLPQHLVLLVVVISSWQRCRRQGWKPNFAPVRWWWGRTNSVKYSCTPPGPIKIDNCRLNGASSHSLGFCCCTSQFGNMGLQRDWRMGGGSGGRCTQSLAVSCEISSRMPCGFEYANAGRLRTPSFLVDRLVSPECGAGLNRSLSECS